MIVSDPAANVVVTKPTTGVLTGGLFVWAERWEVSETAKAAREAWRSLVLSFIYLPLSNVARFLRNARADAKPIITRDMEDGSGITAKVLFAERIAVISPPV